MRFEDGEEEFPHPFPTRFPQRGGTRKRRREELGHQQLAMALGDRQQPERKSEGARESEGEQNRLEVLHVTCRQFARHAPACLKEKKNDEAKAAPTRFRR